MNTVKMKDLSFSKDVFRPMLTGTPLDEMFSFQGGIYPATNYMLIGDPGSGKTTIGLDILAQVKRTQKKRKVLFISAEMNQIDMYGVVNRYPKFKDIDILFTGDFLDKGIKEIIESELDKGYDLVLADSFIEIQESAMESSNMNRNQSEKWIIDLMNTQNMGNNKANVHTSFIMIQQVTKGGQFAGSNKLKHNTTGMCELRMTKDMSKERFVTFTKNRRGSKHDRLYYSLENNDDVFYDQKRLSRDEEVRKLLKKENDSMGNDLEDLNSLLNSLPDNIELPNKNKTRNSVNYDFSNDDVPF